VVAGDHVVTDADRLSRIAALSRSGMTHADRHATVHPLGRGQGRNGEGDPHVPK
jgi:hypothetical protein